MRAFAIGLAAAMCAAVLLPTAALAAKPAAPAAIGDAKSHQQGMTDAPGLIQQTGISCTPVDANYAGQGKTKDANGKENTTKVYELACQEGLGYVIMAPSDGPPNAFDCLAMSINKPVPGQPDKHSVYCLLPQNAEPLAGIQPLVAKAGASDCMVNQARYMGSSPDGKMDQYEVGCANGRAFVLQNPRAGATQKLAALDCLNLKIGDCPTYLPKDRFLALMGTLAAPASRPCQITDARWMGSTPSGQSYYEIACTDEKAGYVLQVSAQRQYEKSYDCARATALGGGCILTAAAAAETQEVSTYTGLAKSIGYSCNVKSYHSFGTDSSGREVVELACADHPDGAIAMLPVDKGQKGEYMNCARAEAHQLHCSLTQPADNYAKLSSEISATGKSCQVTNARGVGTGATGDDYVEVSCTGRSGAFIEFAPGTDSVKSLIPCVEAKGIGGGCKLP